MLKRGSMETRNSDHSRAVANGPVGPDMAGPIIEPVIKKQINFLNFFSIYFWLGLVGKINERVIFLIFFLKRR